MELVLIRTYHEKAVNGELFIGDKKICNTIELPWKENKRYISCIPEGKYRINRRFTKWFGWHIYVEGVPKRTGILIHSFNDAPKESKGCIGPVLRIDGVGKGSFSTKALINLMDLLDDAFDQGKPVFLTIKKQER